MFRRAERAAAAVEETGRTVSMAVRVATFVVLALVALVAVLAIVKG